MLTVHGRMTVCGMLWVAVLAMALCGPAAAADTHYVDLKSPNPAEPYATRETAAHDIQSAIKAAEAGDTVEVAAGTYLIGATVVVRKAIIVQGAGADKTTIDAGGKRRCVVLGGGATFKGFTVTGGKARTGGRGPVRRGHDAGRVHDHKERGGTLRRRRLLQRRNKKREKGCTGNPRARLQDSREPCDPFHAHGHSLGRRRDLCQVAVNGEELFDKGQ